MVIEVMIKLLVGRRNTFSAATILKRAFRKHFYVGRQFISWLSYIYEGNLIALYCSPYFSFGDLGAMEAREKVDAKLDKVSVLISGVCLFHCASFPVVLLVGSSVSALAFFSSHLLHQILLFLALPLSYFALLGGYRTH